MTRFFTFTILFAILISCKKGEGSSITEQPPGPATFRFISNGKSYEFNGSQTANNIQGSIIKRINFGPTNDYFLTASNGMAELDPSHFNISIPITENEITLGTFHSTIMVAIGTIGNIHYGGLSVVNENYSITISSITSGYASGTFTAILFPIEDPNLPTQNIVNGEFKNIKIVK